MSDYHLTTPATQDYAPAIGKLRTLASGEVLEWDGREWHTLIEAVGMMCPPPAPAPRKRRSDAKPRSCLVCGRVRCPGCSDEVR